MWCHSLVLACCLLAAHAAPTTPETLVVTATDGKPAMTLPPATAPSTEAPPPAIKLVEMSVASEVSLRYARTGVLTRVRNPAARAQEATFRVLLPETAFISGFIMTLDGKSYKAYVKEKEEAKQIYNQAVSQGVGAAHIATKARDSNHFTVSVNVEPNTEAVFNLTYEELLVRRNSVYSHAINLHPGTLVPKLTVTVHIKEAQKITNLRSPAVRTGNEVDDETSDNTKAIIERGHDDREATITFSPDLEEQKRLMDIYAEKSKESRRPSFQPWYHEQQEDETRVEGVLGQFVVQYDVERPKDGEILVNDGYFVHYFAPPALPPLSKHVVFVLDTSGSMHSRKIEQLRDAMASILKDLREGDYFNIIEFSSFVKVHDLNSTEEFKKPSYYYNEMERPVALVPPARATPDNVARAQRIIEGLTADGGTYIDRALSVAVDLIHKGVHWTATATTPTAETTPIAPEATPTAPETKSPESTTELVDAAGREARDLATEKDESGKPEPMIIFLTDGEPTIGESNTDKIISRLSEKNYGERKATIFSLAFGEDADRSFLRKLSLRNDGFMRHIYEAADSALQLRHFYRQVASPLLADVKFTYPPAQIKEGSLTKRKFRTYFAGSEVLVAGRLDDAATELSADVEAFCGVLDDDAARKVYKISPKVPIVHKSGEYLPLERVWAYLTIQQLLDARDAEDKKEEDKGPAKRALELALKYEFVTPLTSLVVVKPNATTAVDSESVDKTFGGGYALAAGGPVPNHQYSSLIVGGAAGPAASFSFPLNMASADSVLFEDEYDSVDPASIGIQSESWQSSIGPSAADLLRPIFSQPGMPGIAPPPAPSVSHPPLSTTPRPAPAPSTAAPATALPSPALASYHLQDYPWAAPLLDPLRDELFFEDANATEVRLKLNREKVKPTVGTDPPCRRSVTADAGTCVYLTRCAAARDITVAVYKTAYCALDNGFAGVCCPNGSVDLPAKQPAVDFP